MVYLLWKLYYKIWYINVNYVSDDRQKIGNIINDTHLLVINKTMSQSSDNFNSKQKMTKKREYTKYNTYCVYWCGLTENICQNNTKEENCTKNIWWIIW